MASKASAERAEAIAAEAVYRAWDAVRTRMRAVVRDCNCEAGDEMWGVAEDPAEYRLRVWDQSDTTVFVEVTLEVPYARLHCRLRNERWTFHVQPGGEALSRATATYSIEDAVNLILDGLVC